MENNNNIPKSVKYTDRTTQNHKNTKKTKSIDNKEEKRYNIFDCNRCHLDGKYIVIDGKHITCSFCVEMVKDSQFELTKKELDYILHCSVKEVNRHNFGKILAEINLIYLDLDDSDVIEIDIWEYS